VWRVNPGSMSGDGPGWEGSHFFKLAFHDRSAYPFLVGFLEVVANTVILLFAVWAE